MPRVSKALRTDKHSSRGGAVQNIGLVNDYVRIPYANGSSFASRFLYREFSERGHDVTVMGPHDPDARPEDMPTNHLCLPSVPLKIHPGVYLPMPGPKALKAAESLDLDVVLAQSCSKLLALGTHLRRACNVPFLCVNTVHMPSVYNVILPDALNESPRVNDIFQNRMIPWVESMTADVYNDTDGLIVLSGGLKQYWRERGVKVPIHVIPRAVDPSVFDRVIDHDPFPAGAKKGARLLVVCRQTREKGIERLLEIFAQTIAPAVPDATLTIVGDGPDYDTFREHADNLGIGPKVFFVGEYPLREIPAFYRHADLFVYTSLSETYGQVVSEALWCRVPVVALADNMGVSQQVTHGENGILVEPGPNESKANWRFGKEVVGLLRDNPRRRYMAERAEQLARYRSDPERCVQRYYDAFAEARAHCDATEYKRQSLKKLKKLHMMAHWTGIHGLAWGFGLVRPPAIVNRHGRRQSGWDTLRRVSRVSINTSTRESAQLST